jgi:hypothetical protein
MKTHSEQKVEKISNQDVVIQTVNETSNFGNQFNNNMGNIETNTYPLKTPCQNNSNTHEGVLPNLVYRPANPSKKIPIIPAISKQSLKKFMCEVCGKTFTRNHDLKRHMSTPAIHKYIKSVNKQSNPTQFQQITPTQVPSENFDTWQPTEPIAPQARLLPPSLTMKRNANKAKLGNIRIPNKMRPEGKFLVTKFVFGGSFGTRLLRVCREVEVTTN